MGKIMLVDLAASEWNKEANSEESKSMDKSLCNLGNVINIMSLAQKVIMLKTIIVHVAVLFPLNYRIYDE